MEKWVVCAKRADFQKISQEFGIDPVIARLIRNRDVQDREEIRRYLHGTVEELASPHLMKDVDKAVEILRNKLKEKNGKKHIGETINVLVTSVLQTSAGRMIFGKPKN